MISRLGLSALVVLTASDGAALCRLAPSPGELGQGIAAPAAWVDRVGPDAAVGAAAGALLWLTALWLMLGLLVTLAARCAGRPDGLLEALARRITPGVVRRLVTTATGASLVLSPAAVAMPAAVASVNVAPVIASATGTSATPPPPVETTPGPPLDPGPAPGTVLVRPGDSLWGLAAQRLGPSASDRQIAIDWPYWYSANRQVIGRNPDLILPGERLTVPTPQEGSSDA